MDFVKLFMMPVLVYNQILHCNQHVVLAVALIFLSKTEIDTKLVLTVLQFCIFATYLKSKAFIGKKKCMHMSSLHKLL